MILKLISPTFERANATNHPILAAALIDHDKHYWCLCRYLECELKTAAGRRRWISGPAAISHLLGEGHTAATVIWETYSGTRP